MQEASMDFSNRRFVDRADAARQLAVSLEHYRGRHPLVLAIPRGGVPIGRILADALGGELDVVLVRKLGAPGNPEFAIGAIDEQGRVQLSRSAAASGADDAYLRAEAARQLDVIRRRRAGFSPGHRPAAIAGRTVIVVDDGLATGATMRAALVALRAQHPASLVCAVPVAAPDSLRDIAALADEIVCLSAPAGFRAVGAFYDRFEPVEDAQVLQLLAAPAAAPPLSPSAERVWFELADVRLPGDLVVPAAARGLVVFAHGSGSSRLSPRNRGVAEALQHAGMATLLFDLLSAEEDRARSARFDIAVLTDRLAAVVDQIHDDPALARLPLGLFGASTGAAAALAVAALRPGQVRAVVSRGGRPDLAGAALLARVRAPSLLICGGADTEVIALNKAAQARMTGVTELAIVPGATHLFEEPGALETVSRLAAGWFTRWLAQRPDGHLPGTPNAAAGGS
jgi:predicted phosphoribosyltransferase/dienelactone hydrolase